ncbi:hypothetical protein Verru16b_02437 [Lacunisphaera limnophila]|uniref:Uncharacterized protein n=1 Tax=Lacunisphaera limnophila TaxID=1838286 RepID=A0A1D8AWU0_9BACT|nr:hypothetical protein [Lacunisphaera limnophila]AOS45356.1 hypothetical protein Verru16b_02437 [Lacunisphaera limnophila]
MGWLALLLILLSPAAAAPLPDYLRTALTQFKPDAPADWAYTLTTRRNETHMVERYDPARPPAARWTLLQWQGRAPTPEEAEKYLRSRPQADSGGTKANFTKDDIEPGSLTLVREDESVSEWTGRFRETSTGADKMLGRLTLRLLVDKRIPHVAEYRLSLQEPYSPVLGVKMHTLDVTVRYQAPADSHPALPADQTSRFTGRILFFSTQEELQLTYTDYTPPSPELSR